MSTLFDASLAQAPPGSAARSEFSQQLVRCLVDHGYARLKNHGIPATTVRQAFSWSHRFFDLPNEHKWAVENPSGPKPQRGYSRRGAEKTAALYGKLMGLKVPEDQQDAREHWDSGSPNDDEFPNRYPSETDLPGFKAFMNDFYRDCERVSFDILGVLEEAFQIPSGTFEKRCQPHNASELRLNRYPGISLQEMRKSTVSRISPHFDLGVITMLFADSVGGLEFEDRRKEHAKAFVPVEEGDETEIILNISETMQRWTHDALPASLHQVTIPPNMRDCTDGNIPARHSIAYFVKADRQASVGALPEFVPADGHTKYADMTAVQYHQQRLQAAY